MTRTDADGALDEALALVSRTPDGGGHRAAPWQRARETAARAGTGVRARTHRVALADAHGEVLAAPLDALGDLPSFDTSAMDGWAVAGPGPWRIRPGEAVLAGAEPPAPSPTARPYGSPPEPGSPSTPVPSSAASTPASPAPSSTPPGPSAPDRTSARAARNAAPATCCCPPAPWSPRPSSASPRPPGTTNCSPGPAPGSRSWCWATSSSPRAFPTTA